MSTPIKQTIIQFGRETRRDFNVSCEPLDWQPIDVTFPQPFPSGEIHVVVTANDLNVSVEAENNPIVGVVEDLKPTGFRLWGRNPSDCDRGAAGFNWLAIAETPGHEHREIVDVRMGVVQPTFFWGRCNAPNFKFWPVAFGARRDIGGPGNPPVVLATVNNLNTWATNTEVRLDGGPVQALDWGTGPTVAAVGLIQGASQAGFRLKASNSDSHWGNCAFYHLAVARARTSGTDLFVEAGRVGAKSFEPCDNAGDWRQWDISFTDPFMTPPIVLVSANDLQDDGTPVRDRGPDLGKAVAAVGVAQNVTTHGFSLKARSSDCGGGSAGFHWIAFGCEQFCA